MKTIGKVLLFLLLTIILLLGVAFFALQNLSVQNFLKDKALERISNQIQANWSIDSVEIKFFDRVTLHTIYLTDTQNDTLFYADQLDLNISLFRLLKKEINFDNIKLKNGYINISQSADGKMNTDFLMATKKDPVSTSKILWDISVDRVSLDSTKLNYTTPTESISIYEESLDVWIQSLDLNQKRLDLLKIDLTGLDVKMNLTEAGSNSNSFTLPNIGWEIASKKINLHKAGVDYNYLAKNWKLEKVDLECTELSWKGDSLRMQIVNTTGTLPEDLVLSQLKTDLAIYGQVIEVPSLEIKTKSDKIVWSNLVFDAQSLTGSLGALSVEFNHKTIQKFKSLLPSTINPSLKDDLVLSGKSLVYNSDLLAAKNFNFGYGKTLNGSMDFKVRIRKDYIPSLDLNSEISKLTIHPKSLNELLPGLKIPDSLLIYEKLSLSGKLNGTEKRLDISQASIQLDDVVVGRLSGEVRDILDTKSLSFDLDIEDLVARVPELHIPKSDQIILDSLGAVSFKGNIRGNVQKVDIQGDFNSDLGNVALNMKLLVPKDITKLSYDGSVIFDRFDLGTLLNNKSLGSLTLATEINGSGINVENLNSNFNGTISNFEFQNYSYNQVQINAKIDGYNIDGIVNINDPNAKVKFEGLIKLDREDTGFDFIATIDTLRLKELGLYSQRLDLRGDINSKVSLPLQPGQVNKLILSGIHMANDRDTFSFDSMVVTANKMEDSTVIQMDSDFFTLAMEGKFGIKDLPQATQNLLAKYTRFLPYSADSSTSQYVKLEGKLKTLKPLDMLIENSLVQSEMIAFNSLLDFENERLNGSIVIDSFFYGNFFSEKVAVDYRNIQDNLALDLLGTNNLIGNKPIEIISMLNLIQDTSIASNFEALDKNKLPHLKFSLSSTKKDSQYLFSMYDKFVLNQRDWMIAPENLIIVENKQVVVKDFQLNDKNEYLRIESMDSTGNDLNLNFNNFNISQFTALINSKPTLFSGKMDGKVQLLDLYSDFYFLVNMSINDLIYDSSEIGDLVIHAADNPTLGQLTTSFGLQGPINKLSGNGKYNTRTKEVDFNMNISAFELKFLDPFMTGIIKDSDGNIFGKATLNGTVDEPVLNGSITTDKVTTTIVPTNTRYGIQNHTITLDNSSIDIGVLDLYDDQNNVVTLSGKINHDFMQNFSLNIEMNTKKFTFLNTSAKDNEVFFGKLILAANATITGPPNNLYVDVVANSLMNTDITLSPSSTVQFLDQEDFITYGKPEKFQDQTSAYLLKLAQKYPFKVNLLLGATKDAQINFVLDPITGDRIRAKGRGDLRIILNPDGQQEMFGTYTVSEGSYSFSYGDFVSRDFKIQQGGTIRFVGDPLESILDLDAIYTTNTSAYELVRNELSMDDENLSDLKKRTDVQVHLALEGILNEPELSLDIQIPDFQSSTLISSLDRKLNVLRNDPSEMNNQVFGLLLFNSFLTSNNIVSDIGNVGSNLALSSISGLISNQLNKFAENVIKGVELSIDVNSYDSDYVNEEAGGNVTEVGFQVSKQLFHERLTILAGGNIDLTNLKRNEGYSSLVGDFVLEYKLSDNGRYRIRVFSKIDYDRLINENTNRNGISLFFSRSFDSNLKK